MLLQVKSQEGFTYLTKKGDDRISVRDFDTSQKRLREAQVPCSGSLLPFPIMAGSNPPRLHDQKRNTALLIKESPGSTD